MYAFEPSSHMALDSNVGCQPVLWSTLPLLETFDSFSRAIQSLPKKG
jgi:hypothetical protein